MRFLVATVLLVSSVLLVGVSSAALVGPTQGYVTYRITVNSNLTQTEIFTLNQTAQPTSQTGFVVLSINVVSNVRNFTYSNTVNSSSFPEIFPYLVGINNQSVSYEANGLSVVVHVRNTASSQVSFNGGTYTGTKYQLSVSGTYLPQKLELTGNGTIITLPSGLIYSVQLQPINGYSVNAQLWRTSLPIEVATASSLPVGLALVTIGLLGAIAFAVPSIFMRWRKKPKTEQAPSTQPQTEEKPSYWVD
jgi:hypothetical protein